MTARMDMVSIPTDRANTLFRKARAYMDENKQKIRAFLAKSLRMSIQDDDEIFSLGVVNSLFAMQLVLFIEHEFQIVCENEDLDIDTFKTINTIATFIERKTAAHP